MPKPEEFPFVTEDYRITNEWSISLPEKYRRRFEDDQLVIWRPGLTMWISAWDMRDGETPQSTLEWIKSDPDRPPAQTFEPEHSACLCYGYLIHEKEDVSGQPDDRWALYTFTVGDSGHVQMSIYIDDKKDLEKAKQLWLSLKEKSEK